MKYITFHALKKNEIDISKMIERLTLNKKCLFEWTINYMHVVRDALPIYQETALFTYPKIPLQRTHQTQAKKQELSKCLCISAKQTP